MIRKEYIITVVLMVYMVFSHNICHAQDIGVIIGGILGDATEKKTTIGGLTIGGMTTDASNSKVTEKNIEKYKVGKYEVRFSEEITGNNPCYYFNAYDRGRYETCVFYRKDLPEEVKKIDAFKKMTEIEKKQYLQITFLKYANLDLGYVPEPVKAVEAPAEKETASATPAASPAETAAAPSN